MIMVVALKIAKLRSGVYLVQYELGRGAFPERTMFLRRLDVIILRKPLG